jgi:hypothetical protein
VKIEDFRQLPLAGMLPSPDDNRVGFYHGPQSGAPPTERLAAAMIFPRSGSKRRQVLDFIARSGDDGATDEEVSLATGMRLYTAAPRRFELVEDGWLEDSGRTRLTTTHSPATVWVLTAVGRAQWQPTEEGGR